MIPIPRAYFSKPQVLANWVELDALSQDDGAVLYGDVMESLRDSGLFSDKPVASEEKDVVDPNSSAAVIGSVWEVLRRRETLLGDKWPFVLLADSLKRRDERKTLASVAAYSAMLLIEAATKSWYPHLSIARGDKIRTWFEYIVEASARKLFGGVTTRFGAPFPDDWPADFPARVAHLAEMFNLEARENELAIYASDEQQDDTLDVVSRWKFGDEDPGGCPYFLVQCATGENWNTTKKGEPSVEVWREYVSWDGPRYKAVAVPFTLREKHELRRASYKHDGAVVLDRLRLSSGAPDDGLGTEIRKNIVEWCKEKFEQILDSNALVKAKQEEAGKKKQKKKKKPSAEDES